MKRTYEELQKRARELQSAGQLPTWPTAEQRADWAFGNTVIENAGVTLEMAKKALFPGRSTLEYRFTPWVR